MCQNPTMTETETQAHQLVQRKEWQRALELYDQVLASVTQNPHQKIYTKERIVACLLGRSECCLELGRHEAVVQDCRKIIKLLADGNEFHTGGKARKRLVYALFSLRRFSG